VWRLDFVPAGDSVIRLSAKQMSARTPHRQDFVQAEDFVPAEDFSAMQIKVESLRGVPADIRVAAGLRLFL
jgi:hypothetical protein